MSATRLPNPQLGTIKSSWKYLAQEKLPRIDSSTPFKDVYSQLDRSGSSGFLLTNRGEIQAYIKAHQLAATIVQQAQSDADLQRTYSTESIGNLIDRFPGSRVPVAPVPPGADEAALHQAGETVFEISEDDRAIGWYLNHETVRDTATKKTVFICQVGHRNPDSDHGTCYSCPFPIVSTATE
jgi:hypothetical protein